MQHQVLLTGATGFVGKVVLAELLRRREELGIARVYVLIRDKRGKSAEQRFEEEIRPARLFQPLEADWAAHVTPIAGEVTAPDAGIGAVDMAMLRERLTLIVHCAASVEFDLPVREAAEANITGALNMLALARECQRLVRLVSVSTAYVTPWRSADTPVPEALVPLPFDPEAAYADMLAGRADAAALMAASTHPNTYTLTKCVAEHLLVARRGEVPLSIVRPSIVSATLHQPLPGWIDSAAAFAGFVALIGSGYMRALVVDPESHLDVVPCDVVADKVLAELALPAGGEPLRIRHAVAGRARNLKNGMCVEVITAYFQRNRVERAAGVRWIGPLGRRFDLEELRRHTVPLRAGALALRLSGQARQARAIGRVADKLSYVNRAFPYFTHNTFDFSATEPAEMPGFEPRAYVAAVCAGVSRHLLRRDASAVPLAGKRDRALSDLAWALGRPKGNMAIRSFGWAVRKALRRTTEQVSFDQASFERARAAVPEDHAIALVPSHRSYMDFLLCSYVFFARPELGIKIPYIAAAEEFSQIPILGRMFTACQAFYLKRGVGRADPELTRRVHELVGRGEIVEFFIEGARSRSRQFLRPRTGLLRCLQGTGKPVAVLPIAFTYDRVPEEAVLDCELAGEPKPRMSLRGLLRWAGRMARGEVSLGRIHVACGEPVVLAPDGDVHEAAARIMRELQAHTAVTTHHLRCFLAKAAVPGVDPAWLREALERRGCTVIDSELGGEAQVSVVTELSLRQQWLPWFLDDALARWPAHPVLQHELTARRWVTPTCPRQVPDARLDALLDAAFGPLLRDAPIVAERLGDPRWAPRLATPAAVLHEAPQVHLLHAQAVFEDLVARGVLVREADGRLHAWGPEAAAIEGYRTLCREHAPALVIERVAVVPQARVGGEVIS